MPRMKLTGIRFVHYFPGEVDVSPRIMQNCLSCSCRFAAADDSLDLDYVIIGMSLVVHAQQPVSGKRCSRASAVMHCFAFAFSAVCFCAGWAANWQYKQQQQPVPAHEQRQWHQQKGTSGTIETAHPAAMVASAHPAAGQASIPAGVLPGLVSRNFLHFVIASFALPAGPVNLVFRRGFYTIKAFFPHSGSLSGN